MIQGKKLFSRIKKESNSLGTIDVIFCGQIRDVQKFKKSLNDLFILRKEGLIGNIILATWITERSNYKELFESLESNKVIIIESKEHDNPGEGHIWNQMTSLQIGLQRANSERFVLKTRPDIYLKMDFLKYLINSKDKFLIKPLPKGNVFQHKIWLPWFELTKPFYLCDECFLAHYEDMKKMINFDSSYDSQYSLGTGTAHIRRFVHPFLEKYPELNEILKNQMNVGFPEHNFSYRALVRIFKKSKDLTDKHNSYRVRERFRILNEKLKDVEFLKSLGTYYAILFSHFFIDSRTCDNPLDFREHSIPRKPLSTEKFEDNLADEYVVQKHMGQIYVYDDSFLKSINDGKFSGSEISKNISKHFQDFFKN